LTWDPQRRTVLTAPTAASDTRVRTTINKIQPRLDSLIGRLAQSDVVFEIPPTAADDATVSGARLAEQVLRAEHDDSDWEWARLQTLYDAFFGGTSAIALEWDPHAKPVGLTGVDQVVDTGHVALRPLAITDFTLQPGTRRWRDSPYVVICTSIPPEQANEHYRLGYDPAPDATAVHSALQVQLLKERGVTGDIPLCNVYTMYERPCAANKQQGVVVTVIGGKVVQRGAWPFPFDELNVQVFVQKPLPGVWTGTTMMNSARNIQILYNAVRSIIVEHTKMAGNARLLVPRGSLDDEIDLTDEAGEIVEYWAQDGQQPHYMQPADLPRYVYAEPENLERELDDTMSTNEVSRGVAPGDRNSGLALSILAERNDTPLGIMARDQAKGWARLASLTLQIMASKVTQERSSVVWVDDVPRDVRWNGQALQDQWRVKVPLEATSPQSKAAWVAQLTTIKTTFPEVFEGMPPTAHDQMLDMPGMSAVSKIVDADARRAQKENELVMSGEVIFPHDYDDHARHIAEHNRMRKQDSYLYAPEDVRDTLDKHILAHQRLLEEEAASQAALNSVVPGLAALPQASEPIGSAVPVDVAEQGQVPL
jgi:hypothetical protein